MTEPAITASNKSAIGVLIQVLMRILMRIKDYLNLKV